MLKRNLSALCATLTFVMFGSAGCAHLGAPPQLDPAGNVAYHAGQAMDAVRQLQKAAEAGENAGVISRDDLRTIAAATLTAGEAGKALHDGLQAGALEEGAKNQFIATLRKVLTDLPGHLSGNAAKIAKQYCDIALLFLSVFGK